VLDFFIVSLLSSDPRTGSGKKTHVSLPSFRMASVSIQAFMWAAVVVLDSGQSFKINDDLFGPGNLSCLEH
jgi:hypothetical protein